LEKPDTHLPNIPSIHVRYFLIESDEEFIKTLTQITKKRGYRCITALDAKKGWLLAKEYKPDGIIFDLNLADNDNVNLIEQLKADADTKNIPVHVISNNESTSLPQNLKSVNIYKKPVNTDDFENVFEFFVKDQSQVDLPILLIEDDIITQKAICKASGGKNISIVAASTAKEAMEQLQSAKFAGVILDLNLPDMDGIELLKAAGDDQIVLPPIVVYSGKDLTEEEFSRLHQYTNKIVLKEGDTSLERLLNECSLFLHAVNKDEAHATENFKKITETDNILQDKEILLVDDDMRNVYALSMVLKRQKMIVTIATNGEDALQKIDLMPKLDIIIMDIMMPVLDGFETTRRIRKKSQYKNLPIIAVTAKAMPDDKKACIEAGANDYITKPIDADKLLSMMRVWLSNAERRV